MARKRHGRHTAPTRDRDKLFCRKWLDHFDKDRAYREAGFKIAKAKKISYYSTRKLKRFMEYLRPRQEAKAREVAKLITLDQESILKAMARTAVFDPGDYIERGGQIIDEKGSGKNKRDVPRTWEGKPVYRERMRPFHALTPEQREMVEVTGIIAAEVQYRLPTIRERHTAQLALGRQFGMFLDKLIIERHQSRGAHNQLALANVPTPELQRITYQLLPYVGQEFASRLGFTLEDIEEAKKRILAEVPKRLN